MPERVPARQGVEPKIRPPAAFLAGAVWVGVALLVLVGLGSAAGRGIFVGDFGARMDPVRQRAMTALQREDPYLSQRAEEIERFDGRFAANPLVTLLHVLPGGIFLMLAPLQFLPWIRSRHIRWHRWSGRVLLIAALVTTAMGLYFGLRMPYGGLAEAGAIAFFGGLFVICLARAFLCIRRREVARHQWMIRAFSIAIGISTVRFVAAVFDITLAPLGVRPPDLFALSLWTGWAITLGAAELWIRYTRAHTEPVAARAGLA